MRYAISSAVCLVLVFIVLFLSAEDKSSPTIPAFPLTIVVLGDSLVSGHGIPRSQAFPAQLEKALLREGYDVVVINEGVSGDTTGAGKNRLEAALEHEPHIIILEFGANDIFRKIAPEQAKQNLAETIEAIHKTRAVILLAGMKVLVPKNISYTLAFNGIYEDLSDEYDLTLIPFFLEGIAAKSQYNLPDMLHPNAAGVQLMVQNALPYVKEVITKAGSQDPIK